MMQCTRSAVMTGLLALALVSCGPSGPSEQELAQEAEWTWLQEAKQKLDAQRQEVVEMRAQLAEMAAGGEEEVEGEAADVPAASDLQDLEMAIASQTEEFSSRLVAFLNDDPMIEGEPPTERQLAALRMKSDEDIVLAQEWIEKGGDYKRAIDIYHTALRFDPDNESLKQALAEAESNRFMSEERFAQVKKGMTEDDVRSVLGQVNLHNVRDFPDRKVKAWFYPTAEGGAAAAVWFREEKGRHVVYRAKFDEVKPEDTAG